MTRKMVLDLFITHCTECKVCMDECKFLDQVCETPRELAARFKVGYFRERPQVPYSCNLCNLCEQLCPKDLNIGRMCLDLRQQLVKEGLGPLAPHKYVQRDQEYSLSDAFSLSLPDLETGKCQRVFFPGCNLSGYSPTLVIETYNYLRHKLPDTGIMLGCCGAPSYALGEQSHLEEILAGIQTEIKKLGASEIIVACPECYRTLKHYTSQFQLKSLYEVLVDIGLPDVATSNGWTFSLHDSCPTRWEKNLQDSVRTLVERMGYKIEEMEYSRDRTRCCGMGGMALFIDFQLISKITKYRTEEAPFDILAYCASCREAFATYKPSLHVLDLIFNPEWEKDRLKPPNKVSTRRENQSLLKAQLEKRG